MNRPPGRWCVVVLVGASAAKWDPVTWRNTSSRVGVRSVSERTGTPQPSRATATWAMSPAPSVVAISSSRPWIWTSSMPSMARSASAAVSASPATSATMRSAPIPRLRSVGDPSALISPSEMIPTRSASSSASSRYCVVRKIVMPNCSLSRRTSAHTAERLAGSRPVVGSSRNRICGRWINDMARSSRRFMPPEYESTRSSIAVADVDEADHVVHPGRDVGLAQAVQPALQVQHLPPGLLAVDRGVLQGHPDPQPDVTGLGHHVEAGDRRRSRRRRDQRAEHLDRRGLAGAVRTEEPVDLAVADGEVDAGDRVVVAERLAQVPGLDRRAHSRPTWVSPAASWSTS